MKIENMLLLHRDLIAKQKTIDQLKTQMASATVQEKAALKVALKEYRRSCNQLETALKNEINKIEKSDNMLPNKISNYQEFESAVNSLLREPLNNYHLERIYNQITETITQNYLKTDDMITGIELSSSWTRSGNTELIDFINIDELIDSGDSLDFIVTF